MSACAICQGPRQETFFTRQGDAVCRACFWQDQSASAEQRAIASQQQSDAAFLAKVAGGVELAPARGHETARKAFIVGALLVVIGLGLGGAVFSMTGDMPGGALLIVGLGGLAVLQGFRLRRG